ncbi:hypothetical protein [Rhizobium alvei]|uniref:Uncharacterized protein n=1 Tax=Rhizobium alvei TaxID=1132659 RepID=A0ABT8YG03_9HYPH|nr:hypothetical protein [Rhizobium alvei]MDO6962607.1 hypothetical protein [Rhizobium alvei]
MAYVKRILQDNFSLQHRLYRSSKSIFDNQKPVSIADPERTIMYETLAAFLLVQYFQQERQQHRTQDQMTEERRPVWNWRLIRLPRPADK